MSTIIEMKTDKDRTLMHVLYAMHTIAWASAMSLAVIAVIINYVRRGDEHDALYVAHHTYMIRTFWWTLAWLVLLSPLWLLFFAPGAIAYTIVGFWYLYRCIKGWLRFSKQRLPVELT